MFKIPSFRAVKSVFLDLTFYMTIEKKNHPMFTDSVL